jgi:hypothetical protein
LKIQQLIFKTFMASVLGLLILGGGSAMAQTSSSSCSLQNIAGSYAYTASGSLSPSTDTPFAAVGVLNISANDSIFNASGSDTANALGVVVSRTFTGTITVNADCTGTVNVNFVGAPFDGNAVMNLVFEDGRKGVRGVQLVPLGPVITLSARRQ